MKQVSQEWEFSKGSIQQAEQWLEEEKLLEVREKYLE
jgi:hypothetical protein